MIVHRDCPCGGVYEEVPVLIRFPQGEAPIELRDVPQGSCPRCGSRVYTAAMLERIESVYQLAELSRR